jgi:hypothetical protein
MSRYAIINGKRVVVPDDAKASWIRKNVDSVQSGDDLLVDAPDGKSRELKDDTVIGKGEKIVSIPKIVKGQGSPCLSPHDLKVLC